MPQKTFSELAAAGLLSGSLLIADKALAEEKPVTPDENLLRPIVQQERLYHAVHDCAGLNVCRGLGGCKVSDATLHRLARAAGVDPEAAGRGHDCAGKNACKGLGGCRVDAERFALLKTQLPAYAELHACAGLNSCKGLGGCKVSENELARLAKRAGVALDQAGEAHDCAGKNACKGLGGCRVNPDKLKELKANRH